MRIELRGCDTASCGEHVVKNINGPICKLARKMISCGVDADMTVTVWRDGIKCFTDGPLSYWAGLATSENDNASVRLVPFVPFSGIT